MHATPGSLQRCNGSNTVHSRRPLCWHRLQALLQQVHQRLGRFLGHASTQATPQPPSHHCQCCTTLTLFAFICSSWRM